MQGEHGWCRFLHYYRRRTSALNLNDNPQRDGDESVWSNLNHVNQKLNGRTGT